MPWWAFRLHDSNHGRLQPSFQLLRHLFSFIFVSKSSEPPLDLTLRVHERHRLADISGQLLV
eukprot:3735437-Heterocapsa_arctica.AAC.1